MMPNKVTGANAGGQRQLAMGTRRAAPVAQFFRLLPHYAHEHLEHLLARVWNYCYWSSPVLSSSWEEIVSKRTVAHAVSRSVAFRLSELVRGTTRVRHRFIEGFFSR